MPRITVILPVYHGAQFGGQAISSLLEQTYRDFDLLIINDGSTDTSGSVADAFASQDERVRVLHQDNRGLIDSLNRGLDDATGDYIARMDADDVSLPRRFEKQVAFLDGNPDIGVVGSRGRLIDAEGREIGWWPTPSQPALAWRMMVTNLLIHPSVVMRRDLLKAYPERQLGPRSLSERAAGKARTSTIHVR